MGIHDIIHTMEGVRFLWREFRYESGQLYQEWKHGVILTMRDGSRWFHGYSGEQPRRLP